VTAQQRTPPPSLATSTPGETLPLARHLTDPAIEEEIQQLAAEAPPMTVDQASRLARLLRLRHRATGDTLGLGHLQFWTSLAIEAAEGGA